MKFVVKDDAVMMEFHMDIASYGFTLFALVKQRALVQKREEGFPNSSQPLSPCFVLGTTDFMRRDDATTGFSNSS